MTTKAHLDSRGVPRFVRPLAGVTLLIAFALFVSALLASRTWQDSAQQQIPASQQSTTVSNVGTTRPDPTAGWNIYSDTLYGYSLKYPPTWIVSRISTDPEERQRRVDFLSAPLQTGRDLPVMVSVTVYENPQRLSASEWVQRDIERLAPNHRRNVELEHLYVAGAPAVRVVGFPSAFGTMDVFLTKDFYTYLISLTPYDPKGGQAMQDRVSLLDLMLSSFEPRDQ
jgi:hypothetical protein